MVTNPRIQRILIELLETKQVLTSQYFSKLLGVTTRTIRQDIKAFNMTFFKGEHAIMTIQGKGYQLHANYIDHIKKIVNTKISYDKPIDPIERLEFIKQELFLNQEQLKLDLLSEKLCVSESTIKRDIRKINEEFKTYDMKLMIQDDVIVDYKESDLRDAMIDFVLTHQMIHQDFQDILHNVDHIIRDLLNTCDIYVSQQRLNRMGTVLTTHLYRELQGYALTEVHRSLLQLPFYLRLHKKLKASYQIDDYTLDMMISKLQVLFDESLQKYNLPLSADKSLINHLNQTFDMHFDKEFLNKIELIYQSQGYITQKEIEEVKKLYPVAFEIALYILNILSQHDHKHLSKYHLHRMVYTIQESMIEDEYEMLSHDKKYILVSHLDMYQNQFLVTKLSAQFKHLKLQHIIADYQLSSFDEREVDIIISTKTLSLASDKVIVVNPNFKSYDALKLKTYLKRSNDKFETHFKLTNHFKESLFFSKLSIDNPFEIIQFLCQKLNQVQTVSKDFLGSVIKREGLSSTYLHHFVAIPHAIDEMPGENVIAIAILDKPMMWFEHRVQLVFLLNIKNPKEKHIEEMFNKLYEIIEHKPLIDQLLKANNYYEFIEILNQVRMKNEN